MTCILTHLLFTMLFLHDIHSLSFLCFVGVFVFPLMADKFHWINIKKQRERYHSKLQIGQSRANDVAFFSFSLSLSLSLLRSQMMHKNLITIRSRMGPNFWYTKNLLEDSVRANYQLFCLENDYISLIFSFHIQKNIYIWNSLENKLFAELFKIPSV